MGLFDKFKKSTDDLDKQIAEVKAKNEELAKNADAMTLLSANGAKSAISEEKKGCKVVKIENNEKLKCSCGCGNKAESIFEIGNIAIPMANNCGNKISVKHLGIGEEIYENPITLEAGNFSGKATVGEKPVDVDISYGLATKDNNKIILFNEINQKGLSFTWNEMFSIATVLDIID